MICTHTPVPNIITKACTICMLYKNSWNQGRAVKFHQPENNRNCAQRDNFFSLGVSQKSSGVGCSWAGCSGVEIPSSGDENGG